MSLNLNLVIFNLNKIYKPIEMNLWIEIYELRFMNCNFKFCNSLNWQLVELLEYLLWLSIFVFELEYKGSKHE